jgi:hypothetical protein
MSPLAGHGYAWPAGAGLGAWVGGGVPDEFAEVQPTAAPAWATITAASRMPAARLARLTAGPQRAQPR